MSLKKKLVVLILMVGVILLLVLALDFVFTMGPSMKEQKVIFIKKAWKQIQGTLAIEEENIALLCRDWSDWGNLITYVKNPTPQSEREFERHALPNAMFTDGMMDMVVIMDLRREILFYKNYRQSEGYITLKEMGISRDLKKIGRLINRRPRQAKGIINTPHGPVMFVANPILDRTRLNRKEGVLIMGRYVGGPMLKRFSSYTVEKIQTLEFEQGQLEDFRVTKIPGGDIQYCEYEDKITVFYLLEDINKKRAMVLFTRTDNRIFVVLNQHVTAFIVITLMLISFLGLFIYHTIDKYLLKRMVNISDRMARIEGFEDLSIRIDSDGNNDELSHLITDINLTLDRLEQEKINRETAEKSMIKQEKLASIGRLASSIAHEVNNPLVAIGSSIQVIKKICKEKEDVLKEDELLREALEISESEVERIRDITSGLLDFHRSDREGFSRVKLEDIIHQSLAVLGWGKKLETINVMTDLEKELFIYGAPVKLKQVFINFISNAVEAIRSTKRENDGGNLRINLTRATKTDEGGRKFVDVHFYDDGPGLPLEVKGSLFEPFVTSRKNKGVGLGLYISYKIVEAHSGEIIYDETYSGGTHFIIRLPVDRRREERIKVPFDPML